jgi:hypothetical protein
VEADRPELAEELGSSPNADIQQAAKHLLPRPPGVAYVLPEEAQ